MSFKFGYLGGSNIGESYNRLLSTSDLKDLDKEVEYLVLINKPTYPYKPEFCFLRFEEEFEVYVDDGEDGFYSSKATWVIVPKEADYFEATDLESKFLILNKDDWEF